MSYHPAVKERAYKIDPTCWISYNTKRPEFKRAIDARRSAALDLAQRMTDAGQYDVPTMPVPDRVRLMRELLGPRPWKPNPGPQADLMSEKSAAPRYFFFSNPTRNLDFLRGLRTWNIYGRGWQRRWMPVSLPSQRIGKSLMMERMRNLAELRLALKPKPGYAHCLDSICEDCAPDPAAQRRWLTGTWE